MQNNFTASNLYLFVRATGLKPQPHEGELTGRIVDELRIRLILDEQRTFPCPFVTGGRSHRNRWRLQHRPLSTRICFQRDVLNVYACETNAFYRTLLLHTLAANKHSFYRVCPCGTMNSVAGNRDDEFVCIIALVWLKLKRVAYTRKQGVAMSLFCISRFYTSFYQIELFSL